MWTWPPFGSKHFSERRLPHARAPSTARRVLDVPPVLSGGKTGAHKIDGVGAGFVVPLWHERIAQQIELVSTQEAMAMAMRLAREEGLFARVWCRTSTIRLGSDV
jgi:cysteine synthase